MKTLLDIGNRDKLPAEAATLVVEIGETYCLLSFINEEEQRVAALKVVTFQKTALEESLRQMVAEVANGKQPFRKVILSPAFPQALLVPAELYREDAALLEAAFAVKEIQPLHDPIDEWQVVNCYALPYFLYKSLTAAFPSALFRHAYTPWLQAARTEGSGPANEIAAYFVHNIFRVLVKKEGKLQLVQTFFYTTPADAVYFLLSICSEWGMTPDETGLVLSGFIAEDSSLYGELSAYFRNLSFAAAGGLSCPEATGPDHFFTSLHNLAVCAS